MFVKPGFINGMSSYVSHGCPNCRLECVTLILIDDKNREEFKLLTCERVAVSYLQDLYSLYKDVDSLPPIPPSPVKSVITLQVKEIIHPKVWLDCLKWTRFEELQPHSSLEWFVVRSENSGFYYSVGEEGTLLIPRDGCNSIQIHSETVKTVCGKSLLFCNAPILCIVN